MKSLDNNNNSNNKTQNRNFTMIHIIFAPQIHVTLSAILKQLILLQTYQTKQLLSLTYVFVIKSDNSDS